MNEINETIKDEADKRIIAFNDIKICIHELMYQIEKYEDIINSSDEYPKDLGCLSKFLIRFLQFCNLNMNKQFEYKREASNE